MDKFNKHEERPPIFGMFQNDNPSYLTIAEHDSTNRCIHNRSPFRLQEPERVEYAIKPQVIAIVRPSQFSGAPKDHAMDHLDFFEEI